MLDQHLMKAEVRLLSKPGPLEDTFGRPDINIHQFRNAVEGLRFMGPQGDEYHQDVEVPHPEPRREERDLFLSRPPGRNAAQEEARCQISMMAKLLG